MKAYTYEISRVRSSDGASENVSLGEFASIEALSHAYPIVSSNGTDAALLDIPESVRHEYKIVFHRVTPNGERLSVDHELRIDEEDLMSD